MKHNSLSLTMLLALGASAGCAASTLSDDDDGGGDGDGSGSEAVPTTAEGRYSLVSEFDVATNMPGDAGRVVNQFIDATDSPDDPTRWILERVHDELPDGSFKNHFKNSIPYIAGYLNDRLLEVAPEFVLTVRDVGNKFGQIARRFGTLETLEIGANSQATKTVTGVRFVVDELELDYLFKDYSLMDVPVAGISVMLDKTGRLTIGEHKVPLSYGRVMRIALDEMVIPLVNPSAVTLEDLLKDVVNCQAVGQYTYEAIEMGSPSTFESACLTGLAAGANAIYAQIAQVDTALEFGISGVARGIDKNKDGKLDQIQTGAWSGTLAYGSEGAPLARGTFTGTRL